MLKLSHFMHLCGEIIFGRKCVNVDERGDLQVIPLTKW